MWPFIHNKKQPTAKDEKISAANLVINKIIASLDTCVQNDDIGYLDDLIDELCSVLHRQK